jgi:hypothetical protein
MADPKAAKVLMAARQKARSISATELTQAETNFGDEGGVVAGYRVLRRNDDTAGAWFNGGNFNGLGIIEFDALGPCSQTGTTNRAGLTHWMSGHPLPPDLNDAESTFYGGGSPTDGLAEIEIQVHRQIDNKSTPVWVNAKTGEVNNEMTVIVDGEVVGVNTGFMAQGRVVPFPGNQ